MDGNKRENIKLGSKVLVVQKQDQRTGKLTEGIVEKILTGSAIHPHGIKVRLVGGIVGRVKKYGLSKGELDSVKKSVGLNDLINSEAKEYIKLNLQHIRTIGVREEILFKNPQIYKSPIVRNGKIATVGYKPEVWKDWE